jgi:hypothetical protein
MPATSELASVMKEVVIRLSRRGATPFGMNVAVAYCEVQEA